MPPKLKNTQPIPWSLLIKLLLSIAMVAVVVRYVDVRTAATMLVSNPAPLLIAIIMLALQSVVAALRLPLIAANYGHRVTFMAAFKLWLIGLFGAQALVTFVAGDTARILLLKRQGVLASASAAIILFDRITGIAVLLALSLICIALLWPLPLAPQLRAGLLGLAGLCLGLLTLLALALWASRRIRNLPWFLTRNAKVQRLIVAFASTMGQGFQNPSRLALVTSYAVLMHGLNVVVFYCVLHMLEVPISFPQTALVVFPAILLSLLPISFAGWGVREGAMVTGFSLFAVPPQAALLASIIFGLGLLVTSLPGGILLLQEVWRRHHPSRKTPASE